MKLREIARADWRTLLELNSASVQELSELDEQRLESLLSWAQCGLVAESEGALVAFALALPPGTPYDSDNYRWFGTQFERFLYLDRIVVSDAVRRRGVAGQLYDAIEASAVSFERMVCEVNLQPPNDASLAFHSSRGYAEIGRLEHPSGKIVALLTKELAPSAHHAQVGLPP
jgi:predicted GNAT superfamily acetyltransferase